MKDKVVLITGGAAGIGKATADAFLAGRLPAGVDLDVNSERYRTQPPHGLQRFTPVQSAQVDVKRLQCVESASAAYLSAGDRAGCAGKQRRHHHGPLPAQDGSIHLAEGSLT